MLIYIYQKHQNNDLINKSNLINSQVMNLFQQILYMELILFYIIIKVTINVIIDGKNLCYKQDTFNMCKTINTPIMPT